MAVENSTEGKRMLEPSIVCRDLQNGRIFGWSPLVDYQHFLLELSRDKPVVLHNS